MDPNSTAVRNAAAAGARWAVRWRTTGWSSLSKAQKAAAKTAIGVQPVLQTGLRTRRVSAPVAVAERRVNPRAKVATAGRLCVVSHTELVGTVSSNVSTSPVILSRILNPSNVLSFPWLSILASGFEKYKFSRLALIYSPCCSTSTSGRVVLAFDKDSTDEAPSSKADLYNHESNEGIAPWSPARLTLPTDNVARFVSDNSASDGKLVDAGKALLATYGQSSSDSSMLGELFIEYSVSLITPQYATNLTQVGSGSSYSGPALFTLDVSTTTYTFTCGGSGRYLITIYTPSVPTSGPTISGAVSSTTNSVASDTAEAVTVNLVTSEPGATVVFVLSAVGSFSWFASRI